MGSAKYYLGDLPFAVWAAEASLVSTTVPTLDLTLGLGYGRFRNVTPLAQAIRIQNGLLDDGLLLAPVEDDIFLRLAAVIGDAGLVASVRLVSAEEVLTGTGLLKDGALGARGLLQVDRLQAVSAP